MEDLKNGTFTFTFFANIIEIQKQLILLIN